MIELFVIVGFLSFGFYKTYTNFYFKSEKFDFIRRSIYQFILECNLLNKHIEELKLSYSEIKSIDYGGGHLVDNSTYKMKRRKWQETKINSRIYNCSLSVLKNAHNQPFKYLCKYFNIKIDEITLIRLEVALNDFSAAEQGKLLLASKRELIIFNIKSSVPFIIFLFSKKRLIKELGFESFNLNDVYFPIYSFQYISPGGNSSAKFDVRLDIEQLEKFINYIGNLIKFRNSTAGQRALMTSALREKIKKRDGYACKKCNISALKEKNLLLEIDHIIPLSRGGITSEGNLQTLCWKCNRKKGARLDF